jgi:signal recognition particle GTPase
MYFSAVLRHIVQLVEEVKAMVDETKHQVTTVFQLLSSGTNSKYDFSDTINQVKQMDTVEELTEFSEKLDDRSFRKQVVSSF